MGYNFVADGMGLSSYFGTDHKLQSIDINKQHMTVHISHITYCPLKQSIFNQCVTWQSVSCSPHLLWLTWLIYTWLKSSKLQPMY